MTTTWEVWTRMIFPNRHGSTLVQTERCIAICATRAIALQEASRIVEAGSMDDTIPDWERAAIYVKPGSLLIGFEVLP